MMCYLINNLLMPDNNLIQIANYHFERIEDYNNAIQRMYRNDQYGTHAVTALARRVGQAEPQSVLFNDGYAICDLLLINNLLSREKACLSNETTRYWHVALDGSQVANKWICIENCWNNLRLLHDTNQLSLQWIRAIHYFLESWNTTVVETKIVLLRASFELLWLNHRAFVINLLDEFNDYYQNHWISQIANPSSLSRLVIGRKLRNSYVHDGTYEGTTDRYGRDIIQSIVHEMNHPHRNWNDGHPSLIQDFTNAIATYGLDQVLYSSVWFLEFILHYSFIRFLGLPINSFCPEFREDAAEYLTTFSSIP